MRGMWEGGGAKATDCMLHTARRRGDDGWIGREKIYSSRRARDVGERTTGRAGRFHRRRERVGVGVDDVGPSPPPSDLSVGAG